MPVSGRTDSAAQTFERALWKAVLGAVLAGILAAFTLVCFLAGEWLPGGFLSVVAVPILISAVRGVGRARRGGLDVTARGLRDHSWSCGWIAWCDVTRVSWNALTTTVTLHLKATPTASKRLNAEATGSAARIPGRIVIHTATLTISRLDLVRLIERRAPLSVRPSKALYLGDH